MEKEENKMNNLQGKDTFTSLELTELINQYRNEEGNKSPLRHDNLLQIIKDEFEEEIGLLKIQETPYIHPQNKQKYPMYVLDHSQSRQVLVRESKFVRKAVIAYIDKLEEKVQSSIPSNLSPQLQLLISIELGQKQLSKEIQDMREVIQLSPNSWRKETSNLISKIAMVLGGYEHIKDVRQQSYDLLNERMGVDVKTRLTNKRRRMADEGVCKSKRDKLSALDVIAEDKKLIEGYIAIVKEMSIKNKVA
jgi:hypothetical protein